MTHILLSYRSIIIFSPLHKSPENDAIKFQSLCLCIDSKFIHHGFKRIIQKNSFIRNFRWRIKRLSFDSFKWKNAINRLLFLYLWSHHLFCTVRIFNGKNSLHKAFQFLFYSRGINDKPNQTINTDVYK